MPMALAPTSNPLPPLRATPARANVIYNALPSYSPCFGVLSNRNKVWLRNGRKPLRFGTVIKCGSGSGGTGEVQEIDESQFSDVVLKSERPVLVEFIATWCGPCRLIAPGIQSLAQEYQDKLTVVKVDHDSNPRLIEEYKVYGLPALILFQNGKEVPESRKEGAITKAKLKEYVDKLLESVSVV